MPSWEKFAESDPLIMRAVEQMLLGVATRKYGRSLEEMPPEVKTRGTSKSAVSRRFVEATSEGLETWLNRSLSELSLAVLMLDGVVCGAHTALVALGIDEQGAKHVLGWRDGTMVLRWVGVGLQEATKGFRRLKGYAGMPKLLAALRAHDADIDGTLASEKKAA